MKTVLASLGALVIFLAALLGLGMLMAYPTMWIVNYLFTAQLLTFVFGVAKIGFWQAFVLNMFFGTALPRTASGPKD
jgi:hypothetical protein